MSLLGDIGNVLGSAAKGIGNVLSATLPAAIPAGLNYLASREQASAARSVAKAAAGASGAYGLTQRLTGGGYTMPLTSTGLALTSGTSNMSLQNILGQLGIQTTAPYVQSIYQPTTNGVTQAGVLGEILEKGVVPYLMRENGKTAPSVARVPGGIPVATDYSGLFTQTGRPRSLVAVATPAGRLAFMRNAGRPIMFSGDVAVCRRIKKQAGKAYRASGGSTSYRKR